MVNDTCHPWSLWLRAAVIAAVVCIPSSLHAGTIVYVDDNARIGGDGQSWATAFQNLQEALCFAAVGANSVTEIRIAQGTYRPDEDSTNPTGTGDRAATFQLINNVTVLGGYRGLPVQKGQSPDDREIQNFISTLSGDLNGDDGPDFANYGENSLHVVTGSGTDATAVLDGVTIVAGNANIGSPLGLTAQGGGIVIQSGSPSIGSCHVTACKAYWSGAGLTARMASPHVTDCVFDHNHANTGGACDVQDHCNPVIERCRFSFNTAPLGGAMYIYLQCNVTLNECEFSNNSAIYVPPPPNPPSGNGGAIVAENDGNGFPLIQLSGCTFINNAAGEAGGAIQFGTPETNSVMQTDFTGCEFAGNSAGFGGAIGFRDGHTIATMAECRFHENVATIQGGAIWDYVDYSPCHATDCEFSNNSAGLDGGAVYWWNEGIYLNSCRFVGNSADDGGGLWCNSGFSFEIAKCRFESNTASGFGGGAFFQSAGDFGTYLHDTDFISNAADDGGGLWMYVRGPILCCRFLGNHAVTGGGLTVASAQSYPLNCLFSGNVAKQDGGALHCYASPGNALGVLCTFAGNQAGRRGGAIDAGSIQLSSCIIWQNMPSGVSGEYSMVDYCDLQEPADIGQSNINADPLFVDADGPDNIVGTEDDNLRLRGGSPCINAGDNTIYPPVALDLDGNPRNLHGVDIGAYEFQNFCAVDIVPNGKIDIDDLALVIENWGALGGGNPADITGNGVVDIDDLVKVITAWGNCPP